MCGECGDPDAEIVIVAGCTCDGSIWERLACQRCGMRWALMAMSESGPGCNGQLAVAAAGLHGEPPDHPFWYPGEWVAISGGKVVAHDRDPDQVVKYPYPVADIFLVDEKKRRELARG